MSVFQHAGHIDPNEPREDHPIRHAVTNRAPSELGQQIVPREEQTLEVLAALQRAEIEKWWPIIRRPVSASIKRARCNERSALALSRRTASGVMPVAATEKAATKRLGVRVFDASEAGWGIINQDLLLSNAKHWVVRRSIDALELDDCARRSACGP